MPFLSSFSTSVLKKSWHILSQWRSPTQPHCQASRLLCLNKWLLCPSFKIYLVQGHQGTIFNTAKEAKHLFKLMRYFHFHFSLRGLQWCLKILWILELGQHIDLKKAIIIPSNLKCTFSAVKQSVAFRITRALNPHNDILILTTSLSSWFHPSECRDL